MLVASSLLTKTVTYQIFLMMPSQQTKKITEDLIETVRNDGIKGIFNTFYVSSMKYTIEPKFGGIFLLLKHMKGFFDWERSLRLANHN